MPKHNHKTSLSICMIVKDEAKRLPLTLPNMVESADEVIIADTGSSDRTKEIVIEMGAIVHDFKWNSDFSMARNFSIKKANSDWVMWLDADEYVDVKEMDKLRDFLDVTDADMVYVKINECAYGTTKPRSFYLRDKIFRNGRGFHFERPVNEELKSDKGVDIKTALFPGFNIYHWGTSLPQQEMEKKNMARIAMYEELIKKDPKDVGALYMLAVKLIDSGRKEDAEKNFYKIIELAEKDNSLMNFEFAVRTKLAWQAFRSGRFGEAIGQAVKANLLDTDNVEPYCVIAASYINLGDFESAVKWIEPAMELKKKVHPVMGHNDYHWDVSRYSSYARCLAHLGRLDEAIIAYKKILEVMPGDEMVMKAVEILQKQQDRKT